MRRPISVEFWRHARCIVGKTRDFPDLNMNKQIAVWEPFDNSCMWKESRICGMFSKLELAFNFICSSYIIMAPEPLAAVYPNTQQLC